VKKVKMKEDERDITVLRVIVEGEKSGNWASYTFEMVDFYDTERKVTSMAKTTRILKDILEMSSEIIGQGTTRSMRSGFRAGLARALTITLPMMHRSGARNMQTRISIQNSGRAASQNASPILPSHAQRAQPALFSPAHGCISRAAASIDSGNAGSRLDALVDATRGAA
jgi:hypothetical protein